MKKSANLKFVRKKRKLKDIFGPIKDDLPDLSSFDRNKETSKRKRETFLILMMTMDRNIDEFKAFLSESSFTFYSIVIK